MWVELQEERQELQEGCWYKIVQEGNNLLQHPMSCNADGLVHCMVAHEAG